MNRGNISSFTTQSFVLVFQLSSADLKKPLETETAKLREMKEKLEGKAPGNHSFCDSPSDFSASVRLL